MRTQRVAFTGPGRVMLEESAISDAPIAPFEVLLRAAYSVISTGTELAGHTGDQTLFPGPHRYPAYPGYATVGEVIAAGERASVRQGELVLAHVPHCAVARFDSLARVCVIPRYGDRRLGSIAGCTEWILACMRDGTLQVGELITDRVAPVDVPAAYADFLEHPTEHMGVVIDWRNA